MIDMTGIKDRRLESTDTLRQIQLTELYLLEVLDRICKKHSIRYCLGWGTLLGAMRHDGFIPWDDDLDVAMPRKDYKKFLKVAPAELPPNLFLQTPKSSPGVFEYFAKVMDLSSLGLQVTSSVERPCGLYVDVFPVDAMAYFRGRAWKLLHKGCSFAWRRGRLHRAAGHATAWGTFLSAGACAAYSIARMALHAAMKLCGIFTRKRALYIAPESGGVSVGVPVEINDFLPFGEHVFEGGMFPVPHDADRVLRTYYGNWRTPPPPHEQIHKHTAIFLPVQTIPFWWTYPHASLSESEAAAITHVPKYLVTLQDSARR